MMDKEYKAPKAIKRALAEDVTKPLAFLGGPMIEPLELSSGVLKKIRRGFKFWHREFRGTIFDSKHGAFVRGAQWGWAERQRAEHDLKFSDLGETVSLSPIPEFDEPGDEA